jgi:hypothetical protein
VIGSVSASNSLVGTTAGDYVGNYGITALSNGNYLVGSKNYASNAGQVLIGTPGNVTFATGSATGSTMSFNPSALTATLASGTAVTLQASNDITVNADILVSGASGGDLTLQAGRNINLNSVITTANGDFTAVAGDAGAIAADRLGGTPTLTLGLGAAINAGTGTVTLAAIGGNFVNNSGSTEPITASRRLLYSSDPAQDTLGGMAVANLHFDQAYTGTALTYAATGNWNLYSAADPRPPAPVLEPVPAPVPVPVAGDLPQVVAEAITALPGGASLLPVYRQATSAAAAEPVQRETGRAGVRVQAQGLGYDRGGQVSLLGDSINLPTEMLTTGLGEPNSDSEKE